MSYKVARFNFKIMAGGIVLGVSGRTVRCQNDNVILRDLLEEQGNGQVIIVDGGGSFNAALFGDIVADIGQKNNWAGVVIYGVIRDTTTIKDIDIGVKALGTNPRKCEKMGIGEKDIPIMFGNIAVKPGDWVYCDEDGFIIAERDLLSE